MKQILTGTIKGLKVRAIIGEYINYEFYYNNQWLPAKAESLKKKLNTDNLLSVIKQQALEFSDNILESIELKEEV